MTVGRLTSRFTGARIYAIRSYFGIRVMKDCMEE